MIFKDDFSQKRPITQVPASWFNGVAKFLNGLVGGFGIVINKSGTDSAMVEVSLDREHITDYLAIPTTSSIGSKDGEIDDHTDPNADDDTDGEEWTWSRSGNADTEKNGLKLDVYCVVANNDGWHYLQRCQLSFSKGGLLLKAELLPGRKEIQG